MDTQTLVNLLLVLLFVLVGGVFAATEMAIVTLREGQVRALEAGGERGRRLADLVRNPNQFLSAVQIGVTVAGFESAAYGASTIAPDIAPFFVTWGLSESVAATVATLVMRMLEDSEETRLSRSLASAAAAMRLNRTVAMDSPITPWGSE